MLNRLKDERGFTLIELLVVVLIIGILAAIALPTFLSQKDKGYDASAKSNARNAVSQIEACGVDNGGDYTKCTTAVVLPASEGIPTTGLEAVAVSSSSANGYVITAKSQSKRTYTYTKDITKTPPVAKAWSGGGKTGSW